MLKKIFTSLLICALSVSYLLISGCPKQDNPYNSPSGYQPPNENGTDDVILFSKVDKIGTEVKFFAQSGDHLYAISKKGEWYSDDEGKNWAKIDIEADGVPLAEGDIKKVLEYKEGAVFMNEKSIVVMKGNSGYGGWKRNSVPNGIAGGENINDIAVVGDNLILSREIVPTTAGFAGYTSLSGARAPFTPSLAGIGIDPIKTLGTYKDSNLLASISIGLIFNKPDADATPPNFAGLALLNQYPGRGDPGNHADIDLWHVQNGEILALASVGDYFLVGLKYESYHANKKGGVMIFKGNEAVKHVFSGKSVGKFIKASDGQGVYAVASEYFSTNSASGGELRYIGEDGKTDKNKDIDKSTVEDKLDWVTSTNKHYSAGAVYANYIFDYRELKGKTHIIADQHGGIYVGIPAKGFLRKK